MMSSSGRRHLVVTIHLNAVCMPTNMVTFKNTQKSPDNGQGWRLVSEHESGKRWKDFGNTWKGFQNLSTFHTLWPVVMSEHTRTGGKRKMRQDEQDWQDTNTRSSCLSCLHPPCDKGFLLSYDLLSRKTSWRLTFMYLQKIREFYWQTLPGIAV